MMQIMYMYSGCIPYGVTFGARCKHHCMAKFHIRLLELQTYRGDIEELKQVAAHEAMLKECPACRSEDVPALPASRWPEGAEL